MKGARVWCVCWLSEACFCSPTLLPPLPLQHTAAATRAAARARAAALLTAATCARRDLDPYAVCSAAAEAATAASAAEAAAATAEATARERRARLAAVRSRVISVRTRVQAGGATSTASEAAAAARRRQAAAAAEVARVEAATAAARHDAAALAARASASAAELDRLRTTLAALQVGGGVGGAVDRRAALSPPPPQNWGALPPPRAASPPPPQPQWVPWTTTTRANHTLSRRRRRSSGRLRRRACRRSALRGIPLLLHPGLLWLLPPCSLAHRRHPLKRRPAAAARPPKRRRKRSWGRRHRRARAWWRLWGRPVPRWRWKGLWTCLGARCTRGGRWRSEERGEWVRGEKQRSLLDVGPRCPSFRNWRPRHRLPHHAPTNAHHRHALHQRPLPAAGRGSPPLRLAPPVRRSRPVPLAPPPRGPATDYYGPPPPRTSYDYAPPANGSGSGGSGGGGSPPPAPPSGGPLSNATKAAVAAAFIVGMGTGVWFNSTATLSPTNVASTEIVDRKTPSSEVCMTNGYSSMVFDQRVFVSFNPFNVYVAQPEVKPGCVMRRSNIGLLEKKSLVTKGEVAACTKNMNTFAFVGDLEGGSPEVSCVYHSEDAENQFLKDPKRSVMGDGTRARPVE